MILIWFELIDKGKFGRCWSLFFVVLCLVDIDFIWNLWDDLYWIEFGFIFFLVYLCRFFFFLGGLGSRKGKFLDDVLYVYGLKLISIEIVLMEELFKKLENLNFSKRIEDIVVLLKVLIFYKYIKFILLIMLIMYYFVYVMRFKEFNIIII